jgi:hypothetical protein
VTSGIGLRRGSWWIALLVLLYASDTVPRAREFRTIEVASLRLTIDSDWAPRTTPGYVPIRFDITNLGDARVIELVGQVSRVFRPTPRSTSGVRPGSSGATTVRQTLRLARGDRVRFTMTIPIFGDNENFRFELREGGRTLDRFNYVGFQSRTPVRLASVLFVTDSSSPFGSIVPKLTRHSGGRTSGTGGAGIPVVPTTPGTVVVSPGSRGTVVPAPGGSSFTLSTTVAGRMPPLDYVLEPARLPVNWTGFTSVRAVAIGKTEWDQLSDPQKSALVTWVACGGDLIFVDGQPSDVHPSMPAEAATDPNRTVGRHFFGRVHALTSTALESAGMADMLTALDTSGNPAWSLPANGAADFGTIETRGFRLRIPGIDGVPARVYLSILVLFSVIIGPVSFWFLWRRGQRVLLVLTAPLISILFIVLLGGYALAGEGFGVHGRAATFTILDEAAKQSATRAAVSMYAAGLAPSGGLRFGRDVAVFHLGPSGTGSRERLTLDLSDGQQYSSGALQPRAPTNIDQVIFRPARERLTFTRVANGYSVLNGLDATLMHLRYRDGETLYTLDGPLAPGAKQILTAGAVDPQQIVPADLALRSKFLELLEQQPRDSYVAVLDRSPFWEPGVADLKERGSFHVVLGWPAGQLGWPAGQLGRPPGQR